MKILGILIIAGILFSYLPIIPMDDCPDGGHMGNMKIECGYLFHCPVLSDLDILAPSRLPVTGRLVPTPALLKSDELVSRIYHPPKEGSAQPKPGEKV